MATHTIVPGVTGAARSLAFGRFAGACGVLAGLVGVGYAVAFLVLRDPLLSALCLLLSGLFSSAVLVALYERLRAVDVDLARWAFVLAGLGALGSLIHGGYDLANTVNPPSSIPGNLANLPSAVDPRGLLTFGVAGIGILAIAWLMQRGRQFPVALAMVGYLLGALLLALYLGRLTVLDAASPLIVVPALVCGFVVNPLWNIWLGLSLWHKST